MTLPFIRTPLIVKTQKSSGNYFLQTMEERNYLPGRASFSRKKNFEPLFLRNSIEKKLKEKI